MAILFVFVIVDLLGFSLILPLLPYYARAFSASPLLIGLLGTTNALAQMIAAPVIGRLSDRYGRRPMLLVGTFAASGLSLLNYIWILAALPESLTPERRAELAMKPKVSVSLGALVGALRRPRVGPILTTQLLYFVAFGLLTANFALYALERLRLEVQATGYILAYVGVLSVLVQGFGVGLLTRRFREQRLALAAMGILTITLLAWGFVPNVPLLLVVFAPTALSAGLLGTLMSSLLTKSVARDEVGGALGLSSSLQSLSQVLAPVVGGLLLGQLGAWSLGILASLLMAMAFLFAWRVVLPSLEGTRVAAELEPSEAPVSEG